MKKLQFVATFIFILWGMATEAQILLRNNFDTASAPLGTGWVNQVQAGSMPWARATSTSRTSPYSGGPYSGSGMCFYDSWNQNIPGVSWLISPAIATSTITSGNAVTVSFWALRHSNSSSSTEMRMSVWAGNTNNRDLATPLDSVYAHNSRYPSTTGNGGWVRYTYTVPSTLLSGANLFFFFRANTDWWNNFYMDEIVIQGVSPMSYSQTLVSQTSTNAVVVGSTNNSIIVAKVLTTGSINPLSASSITFNTLGTSNVGNISNAKCYFTGNSPLFNTSQQFGSTITSPSGSMVFTGNTLLSSTAITSDTNYFWLTYDINPNAPALNVVNASMSAITINSISRTPSPTTNPGAGRIIRIPNVPNNVPISGLMAYWPFSGSTFDSSFNGNNGTISGTPPPFLSTDRFNNSNRSYYFTGDNATISANGSHIMLPDLAFNNWNQFTVSSWINEIQCYSDGESFVYFGNQISIHRNPYTNSVGVSVGNANYEYYDNNSFRNKWKHYLLTYDGSLMKFYIDGVMVNSQSCVLSALTPGNSAIGRHWWSNGTGTSTRFNGKADDIGVWNRALSETEIKRLYNPAGIFVQPKNIVTKAPGAGRFIVQTPDSGVIYQWQTNTGSGFTNLSNGGQFSGVNNDTLLVSNILQINQNQQFRCLTFSGVFRDTSSIAKIVIPNVPSNIPIDGLVAYWPFTGNAIDSSGNGNHGTLIGANLTTNRYGNSNQAYGFNGSSYINIQPSLSLNPMEITVSAWVLYSVQTAGYKAILSNWKDDGVNARAYNLAIEPNDYYHSTISFDGTPNSIITNSVSPVSLNIWKHLVVTYNKNYLNVYVDGILNNSTQVWSSGAIYQDAASLIRIGAKNVSNPSEFFVGKLDDIGIWNRALTQNEIKCLYNPAGIFVQPKNLVTKASGAGSFIVQTADSGITYQWQTNTGSGFTNLSNGGQFSGVNNDTLLVSNILQINQNQQFRCLTFAGLDKDTSNIAKIIIPNVPNNVPIDGLVGYWPFEGNAADSSGNGNNGTVYGATLTTDRYGNANKAYYYDGSSSYINVPNSTSLQFNGGITISTWLNASSSPSPVSYWFSKGSDGGTPYSWISNLIGSTKIMNIGIYDNANNYVGVGSNTALQLNTWINFTVTYDGINAKAYVNGVLENTISCSYNTFANAYDLTFGRRYNSGSPYFWNGKIDDFGVWNRALTQNEIKLLYNPAAIFLQPKNIVTKAPGAGSFIVQTLDSGITYQWQTNTGSGFTNITNGGQYTGINNDTLLVSSILQSNHNQQFRCLTSVGVNRDTSTIAKIIIPNVPQYVSIDGLVGYWPFTGNAIDSSGNGNNGTVYGATLTTDRKGSPNKAYSFNGTSNLIALPKLTGIANQQKVTFSFWENLQNQGCVFSQWSFGNPSGPIGLNAKILNNGSVNCEILAGIGQSSSTGLFTTNTWNHIVLQFDGTKSNSNERFSVYVNGIFKGNFGIPSTPSVIGNQSDSTVFGAAVASPFWDYLSGKLDDIGIWNRILTDEEILNLYISCEPKSSIFTVSACSNYIWTAKGNKLYTSSNNTDTLLLKTIGGCDSIVTLNLIIKQPSTSNNNISICPSSLPYTWNGRNYNSNAIDTIKLVNALGCDSVTILNLIVKPTSTSSNNISICPSALPFTWNGRNYNSSAIDTIKLVNAFGCDSITILNLIVKPTSTSTNNISICQSALPYTWNGRNYNSSAIDTIKLVNALGCDSVTILNLIVKPISTSTNNISVCPSALPFTWNGRNYNSNAIDTIKLVNALGCDSITILNFIVKPTSTSSNNISICQSALPYTWNGRNYNSSAIDTIKLVNALGCDSITILNLIVKPTSTSSNNISICQSTLPYTWNGRNYNSSAIDTITLVNALGCDSITILNLIVKPTSTSSNNISICQSALPYTWNGRNYNSNAIDTITLVNSFGCDSVTVLNLKVKPISTSSNNISICPSSLPFTWNGRSYSANTIDTIILVNSFGCDSITVLNLTIKSIPNTSAIVGLTNASRLDTTSYSVTGLPGSTFNWNAQGATIEGGVGTNKIRVKWQTMGTQQISVTETTNDGCLGAQKTLTVVVGPATGEKEIHTVSNIVIYPNPTKDKVNVKVEANLIGSHYTILDMMGKIIQKGAFNSTEEILNLENVSHGIYFINVGDNLGKTYKIIKE